MKYSWKNKGGKQGWIQIFSLVFIIVWILQFINIQVKADLVNIEGNDYFTQTKIPTGKTGKVMDVTFTFTADRDYDAAFAGIAYDDQVNSVDDNKDNVKTVVAFPFELTSETIALKNLGKLKEGQKKTVTLSARVRRDVPEGYYGVQVYITDSKDGGVYDVQEYINVWISKSTDTTETETTADTKAATFVLGEGQNTPYGVYPNVMNFNINLRNNGLKTAYDITAMMVLDKDDKVFPFDINDASYNRHFSKIDVNQTVELNYSFMIRKDVYSGFYPIKLKIHYREKEDGELKVFETEFYVNVKNKEVEESTTAPTQAPELADKDRAKARLIVDSYRTIPEKVIAGQQFELILVMKNASSDLKASNILFTLESEKVSESAVFSSESGSNSVVVNSLNPGETHEISMKLIAKANVDQRSYSMKILEKFDSPQFKNAEESVSIDIFVNQIARLTIGTVDIAPTSITVGGEADIVVPISNSGRVQLYNVTAKFTAPFIKENSVYVGNIKPGETGNANALVQGIAVSGEDEKMMITISYEDENGEITLQDMEMDLMVTEEMLMDELLEEDMILEEITEEKKKLPLPIWIGAGVLGMGAIGSAIVIAKKKRGKDEV